MVRQVRFSKEDADGFEPPDSPDDFEGVDDLLGDAFAAPQLRSRVRRAVRARPRRRKGDAEHRSPATPRSEWRVEFPEGGDGVMG